MKRSALILGVLSGVALLIAAVFLVFRDGFSEQSELGHLKVAVHERGQICLTGGTGSIAIAADARATFVVRRLAAFEENVEITHAAWSPDGKGLAITWVDRGKSEIALYDVFTGRIRHLQVGSAVFVIDWPDPDCLVIGKGVSFRSPNQLLGPDYESPVVVFKVNIDTGTATPMNQSVESAQLAGPAASRYRVTVSGDNFEFRIRVASDDGGECVTSGSNYYGTIGVAAKEIIALRDTSKPSFLMELVSVDAETCGETVLVGPSGLQALLNRMKP